MYESMGQVYYPTDKGTLHHYLETYERMFHHIKDEKINILEVGVSAGGSIRLWSDYFPNAHIWGYDVYPSAAPGIIDDCKNVTFVQKDVNKISPDEFKDHPLTIAIDDASHILADQLTFVRLIYPQMIKGGMLIVEDIQDIDSHKHEFKKLGYPFEIIDLRNIFGLGDDVLIVFNK